MLSQFSRWDSPLHTYSYSVQSLLLNTYIFVVNSFDCQGDLKRINWSHFARDSRLSVPVHQVEPLYRALKAYDEILNDDKIAIKYKMRPGKCNHRQHNIFFCFVSDINVTIYVFPFLNFSQGTWSQFTTPGSCMGALPSRGKYPPGISSAATWIGTKSIPKSGFWENASPSKEKGRFSCSSSVYFRFGHICT